MLSDPHKRREYDERGFAGVAGVSEEELLRNVDFGDLFADLGVDFADLGVGGGGLFDRFFERHPAGPRAGQNVEVRLTVPLDRIARGGEERVRFVRSSTCPDCRGTRAKDATRRHRCDACQGTGRRVHEGRRHGRGGEVLVRNVTVCAACQGSGEIIDEPCPGCGGRGEVEREESLTVNVPVGLEDRTALRVPGHGLPSEDGGPPGDLFVVVFSAPDPRFARSGADLWREETLSIPEAVLGGTRTVPTLDGSIDVTVPPATQPDAVLRIAGKGLPQPGGRSRGDLFLRLCVHVPERLTGKERGLYEQLRETGR